MKLPRITRENAESLKAKEDAKKSEEHQKIEQKRNQREIEEADRDINAILQDETMKHPNIETVNNQPTTALTESTTPENPKETENLQTQPMQTQEVLSIPTIQAVSQPQPQEPAQSIQPIPQPVQSAQPTQPIVQNVAQVQTQQTYNQQTAQTIQQANTSAASQNFSQMNPVNTPVQPTLNDIERMKIEYAQKMMAQRQK